MPSLERTMFREYDIRGLVSPEQVNEESMWFIGKGFGAMLVKRGIKNCVVGFDARETSERFANIFEKALNSSGISTTNIGMSTTPMCYFAQYLLKIKGVAVITASHNPNGWSGLKLGLDLSSTLVTKDIEELYGIIKKEEFSNGAGKAGKKEVTQAYLKDLAGRFSFKKRRKIVVNGRHGIGGKTLSALLKKCGQDVVEQYCDIDFSYPHGVSNPSLMDMMEETGKKTVGENADFGIAIDADGDRIGLVDEEGKVIYPDQMLILFSRDLLKKHPGGRIVYDVKCTRGLEEDIPVHGGVPVMWMTGHSHIKLKGKEVKAVLAGERSGHIFFFNDYYGFDDACFAALKSLEHIEAGSNALSEIMKSTPKYYCSPVIHAECHDSRKYFVIEEIIKKFKKRFSKVIDINGARVEFSDGWGLIRPSGNLPVMVMVFEAKTPERLEEIQQIFRKELAEFTEISGDWHNG